MTMRISTYKQRVFSLLATAALMGIGPVTQTVQAQTTAVVDVDQFSLTGTWYNPNTSGQGLVFEVYPDFTGAGIGYLAGGWFTFDMLGNQHWYSLQGSMTVAQGATFALDIYDITGGNFNAPLIADPVKEGTATLTFSSCTDASLTYQFNDGRNGTIPQTRITEAYINPVCYGQLPGAIDPGGPEILPSSLRWRYSGAWYNPDTSGQGLYLDIPPFADTFFAGWFTYAPLSSEQTGAAGQRWFTIQGNYDPSTSSASIQQVSIYATSGGTFNAPTPIVTQPVGTADITFNSCSSMTLSYTFTSGEFKGLSGTINEQPVGPLPPSCG